jgi:TolB-like protein/class 3 adenylate cyclase
MAEDRAQRRLAAILAADVAGYSRLMGVDEEGTLARLKGHRHDLLDPKIAEHRGRIAKTTGDGLLVEFASVVDALRCAVEVQRGMAERNSSVPKAQRMEFRVGLNVGDIVIEAGDIYGDSVNVAARLEALAEPGGICVSSRVQEDARGRLDLAFDDLGELRLKNIAWPVRVYRVRLSGKMTNSQPGLALPDRPSMAVLPFTNMSGDPDQEYFSDGISEDIITDLAKLSELQVIARNSSFVFKGKAASVPEVARTLGVRYVLEGSVRKAGARVRVTAQLIDSTTDGHVWADRFDRDLSDIFAVQDELTQEIVSALKVKLTAEERSRLSNKHAVDLEAYSFLLRGREIAWHPTRPGNIEARNLLGRAVAIAPDFAAAQAYLAFTHLNDFINGWVDSPEQSLATGLEIAQRAVAMDEEDPQAHFALAVALLFNRDHDKALAEARRCLALAPSSAEGHLAIARIQIYSGNPADALDMINDYMRLDPLYRVMTLHFLAEAQVALGRYEEAIASLKQRLDRDPNSETSYTLLASCYGHLGRMAESRAAWGEALRISPDFSIERRRRVLPFRDPVSFERQVEGLRKAGLPV